MVEIRAILTLLAMTFLLLPILPNNPIDPWNATNPLRIWLMAIFTAALSFGGYMAVRALGDWMGSFHRCQCRCYGLLDRDHSHTRQARAPAIRGGSPPVGRDPRRGVVMVLRVALVAAALNPPLAPALMLALAAFGLVLASYSAILFFWNGTAAKPVLMLRNPLQLAAAIKMAALVAVILAASVNLRQLFGDVGLLSLAAISGLADVDAITVSMAELAREPAARDAAARPSPSPSSSTPASRPRWRLGWLESR